MYALMLRYQDTPMDLADASLVACAETLNQKRIFTLDSDFYVYRFRDVEGFEVLP
jgi:predicted nucleic acid-binding protein